MKFLCLFTLPTNSGLGDDLRLETIWNFCSGERIAVKGRKPSRLGIISLNDFRFRD